MHMTIKERREVMGNNEATFINKSDYAVRVFNGGKIKNKPVWQASEPLAKNASATGDIVWIDKNANHTLEQGEALKVPDGTTHTIDEKGKVSAGLLGGLMHQSASALKGAEHFGWLTPCQLLSLGDRSGFYDPSGKPISHSGTCEK
jgi:hypothetical protein